MYFSTESIYGETFTLKGALCGECEAADGALFETDVDGALVYAVRGDGEVGEFVIALGFSDFVPLIAIG